MDILPHDVIQASYAEQARSSQLHRWFAALGGGESKRSLGSLIGPAVRCTQAEQDLQIDERGLPLLADRPSGLDSDGWSLAPAWRAEYQTLGADDLLPRIVAVTVPEIPGAQLVPLAANYAEHRVLALKHRWHALGECPVKTAPPYKQIITDDFKMDWRTGSVSSYKELEAWLQNSASSMSAARHDIAAFALHKHGADRWEAVFEFDWHGISLKGDTLQAQSRHTWQVCDSPDEPYARIERMDVEFLVPFHVVS